MGKVRRIDGLAQVQLLISLNSIQLSNASAVHDSQSPSQEMLQFFQGEGHQTFEAIHWTL